MGLKRKLGGMALTAIGTITGMAPLIAAGTALTATSGIGNKPQGGGMGSAVPSSSRSIGEARSQDKARMKRSYGL